MRFTAKITALILIMILLFATVSCQGVGDVVREEKGLTFVLPKDMTKVTVSDYDIYYDSLYTIFAAVKMEKEEMDIFSLPADASCEEVAQACIFKLGLTEEQGDFKYDKSRNVCTFYYTYDASETVQYFCYTTILGSENGGIWMVEMICEYRLSADYKTIFEGWSKRLSLK